MSSNRFSYLTGEKYPDHGFDQNLKARLMYDGRHLYLPQEFAPAKDGAPIPIDEFNALIDKKQQLQGSAKEVLCELAGRVCYDSVGTGRTSAAYWEHIRQVQHGSVIEHAWYTMILRPSNMIHALIALSNRRGIWVEVVDTFMRITVNLRAVLEWRAWSKRKGYCGSQEVELDAERLGDSIYGAVKTLAPLVVPEIETKSWSLIPAEICEPVNQNEQAVSIYLSGSRGFSHEQVRHREGISQRSSRFCDESSSPYVEHPLVTSYLKDKPRNHERTEKENACTAGVSISPSHDRITYDQLTAQLQTYVLERNPGLDNTTARKQARGAARGYLGNALFTEMVFTCSVASWREILKKRASDAADAEIRNIMAQALYALQSSALGHHFEDFKLQPAKDGLGLVVVDAKQ